jgi:hypothetical protein
MSPLSRCTCWRTIRQLQFVLGTGAILLLGCATDKTTFLNYGNSPSNASPPSRSDLKTAPDVSDGLAINYANSIEIIMRCKATQSRITREASSTAQIALAAFAGAGAAFHYGATTLTVLGMSSAGIPELQKIFDAKGRSEAYNQAAEMIHDGVLEFYEHNSRPSSTDFTPNGVTLVKKVSTAINLINDTLTGHLPTRTEMLQAVEGMSPKGAEKQEVGKAPVNSLTAASSVPVQKLKPVILPEPARPGTTPPPDVLPVLQAAGDTLRTLDKAQAQKALSKLAPTLPPSDNPHDDITAILIDITSMDKAVGALKVLRDAKSGGPGE